MTDLVVGIDIGGTKIAAGLLDRQGNFLARAISRSHAGCPPDQVVEAVVQTASSLLPSAGVNANQVAGVGVGCAGHINCDCGIVLTNSNLPEAAILGVGRIAPKVVPRDGQAVIRSMCTLSLVFDHRVVDGAPAARFLSYIRELVEEPYLLVSALQE